MTLVKFNHRLPSVFSNLFDDFFDESPVHNNGWNNWTPSINVKESKNDFQLEIAAPGLEKKDFNINTENNILTVSGGKESSKEDNNERYTRREFRSNSFKRSFTLPESVNSNGIKAEYINGILNVVLPKKEEAKEKPAKVISIS